MLGIARDDRETTREMIQKGLQADVIITLGGGSVGDHDFVKEVIEEMGELKFRKINMKRENRWHLQLLLTNHYSRYRAIRLQLGCSYGWL